MQPICHQRRWLVGSLDAMRIIPCPSYACVVGIVHACKRASNITHTLNVPPARHGVKSSTLDGLGDNNHPSPPFHTAAHDSHDLISPSLVPRPAARPWCHLQLPENDLANVQIRYTNRGDKPSEGVICDNPHQAQGYSTAPKTRPICRNYRHSLGQQGHKYRTK